MLPPPAPGRRNGASICRSDESWANKGWLKISYFWLTEGCGLLLKLSHCDSVPLFIICSVAVARLCSRLIEAPYRMQ